MFLWCVRDGWRQWQSAILTQLLLLTIARCVIFKNPLSISSASWLGLLNRGVFSVCKRALTLDFLTNWFNGRRHLPIFFHNIHLLPFLLLLIYTGASLTDGSVKGQYITAPLHCHRSQIHSGPYRVIYMGQIELKWVLMLNWITWNRTVLIFKQITYAKLNSLKYNCFIKLNSLK